MAASNDQQVSARVPNRFMLVALMVVGLLVLLGGICLLAYHVWYDIADPHGSYSIITSVTIQTTTGLHWWQCFAVIAVGSVLFGIPRHFYWEFYVIVHSGEIVNLYSEYPFGVRVFSCELMGFTRAGEQRVYRREVSYKTWSGLRQHQMWTWN